jgi:YD repeat-containing protein
MTITGNSESTNGYDQLSQMVTTTITGKNKTTYTYNGDGLRMSVTTGSTRRLESADAIVDA